MSKLIDLVSRLAEENEASRRADARKRKTGEELAKILSQQTDFAEGKEIVIGGFRCKKGEYSTIDPVEIAEVQVLDEGLEYSQEEPNTSSPGPEAGSGPRLL